VPLVGEVLLPSFEVTRHVQRIRTIKFRGRRIGSAPISSVFTKAALPATVTEAVPLLVTVTPAGRPGVVDMQCAVPNRQHRADGMSSLSSARGPTLTPVIATLVALLGQRQRRRGSRGWAGFRNRVHRG